MIIHKEVNPENSVHKEKQNFPLGALVLFLEILISLTIASIVKLISIEVSLIVILFFRYVFCLPILLLMGFFKIGKNFLLIKQRKTLVYRCITGLLGLVLWLLAVIYLDISLATALFQTLPIFITIMAPFMLGEKLGFHRISAIIAGFFGVIILLHPSFIEINKLNVFPGLLIGILCPFVCSLMFIFLRKLGNSDSPVSTSIWYNFFGVCVFGLLCIIMDVSFPPLNTVWLVLIGCGILASFQQYFLALSHLLASASSLAVVHYSAIPISIIMGIIIFEEKVTFSFLIGVLILVFSNHYIYLREKQISSRNIGISSKEG